MRPDHLPARIALVVNGVLMAAIYPLNMLVLEKPNWIWATPARNMAQEHMLVAIYVTLGLMLIWAARNPLKAVPLIDFAILSGFVHATTMAWDAWVTPSETHHLALRADVLGTYIAPITLALTHPRRFYLFPERVQPA